MTHRRILWPPHECAQHTPAMQLSRKDSTVGALQDIMNSEYILRSIGAWEQAPPPPLMMGSGVLCQVCPLLLPQHYIVSDFPFAIIICDAQF